MFATYTAPASSSRGATSFTNRSTPMFCSPIAFSIPAGVSTIRPGALPGVGRRDSPLTITAPRRDVVERGEFQTVSEGAGGAHHRVLEKHAPHACGEVGGHGVR